MCVVQTNEIEYEWKVYGISSNDNIRISSLVGFSIKFESLKFAIAYAHSISKLSHCFVYINIVRVHLLVCVCVYVQAHVKHLGQMKKKKQQAILKFSDNKSKQSRKCLWKKWNKWISSIKKWTHFYKFRSPSQKKQKTNHRLISCLNF